MFSGTLLLFRWSSRCWQFDLWFLDFPGGSEVKVSACNVGDLGSIPGSGRSPGEGNGNPLQYSCLENPMVGGAWWAIQSMGSQKVRHNWATSLSLSLSSAFSKASLNIWKFTVRVLWKPGLENFENYFARVWDEYNCAVVWTLFAIAFLWDWNESYGQKSKYSFLSIQRSHFPKISTYINIKTGSPKFCLYMSNRVRFLVITDRYFTKPPIRII